MEFGAHLPLISFQGERRGLAGLEQYAKLANSLGYKWLCANDHFIFSRPWLDGPTSPAAVIGSSGTMQLATTVSIPIVRVRLLPPRHLRRWISLSNGRLVVGVGPGSSPKDFAAAGIPFDERWKRLNEMVRTPRAFWDEESEGLRGKFYSTDAIVLEPRPVRQPGPPIWIGSWGSPAGLRRVARLADRWLASGYNTTPEQFGENLGGLGTELSKQGKDTATFPNGIATMWLYVTKDASATDGMIEEVLSPMLRRDVGALREKLLIGDPETCADKLSAYGRALLNGFFCDRWRPSLSSWKCFRSKSRRRYIPRDIVGLTRGEQLSRRPPDSRTRTRARRP